MVFRPIGKRAGWDSFSAWILILRSEGGATESCALAGADSGACLRTRDRLYPTFRAMNASPARRIASGCPGNVRPAGKWPSSAPRTRTQSLGPGGRGGVAGKPRGPPFAENAPLRSRLGSGPRVRKRYLQSEVLRTQRRWRGGIFFSGRTLI